MHSNTGAGGIAVPLVLRIAEGWAMAHPLRPGFRDTIVYGGLTVALLDAGDATIFFGSRGSSPERIAQYVASSLLGPASFDGGAATIALGTVLHVCVALSIATAFWLISQQSSLLVRHPIAGGLGFGVIAYFVMSWVIVPLTRAKISNPPPWPVLVNGIVGHALLIGLPIALFAARSLRRAAPAAR